MSGGSLTKSLTLELSAADSRHYQQAIRRWGTSLAVRLPADCLRQAGLRKGDPIEIVVGEDGRLSLKPLRRLQATMPLTPAVIEQCRAGERC